MLKIDFFGQKVAFKKEVHQVIKLSYSICIMGVSCETVILRLFLLKKYYISIILYELL